MRRLPFLGLVLVGLVAAGWTALQARRSDLEAATERSVLRERVIEATGFRRQASAAGISLQRPRVEPLDEGRLGPLAAGPDFHAFRHRCTSCHDTPDPSMHTPAEWREVVARMNGWMRKAGVLPLSQAERTAVEGFLGRAARRDPGR